MKKFLLLVVYCLLSCKAPPPVEPTLEVSISEQMYRAVTCRLKNNQLAWYEHEASKDFVVHAKKTSTVQYVSSQSDAASTCVYLEKYVVQEPDAPLKEISFFHTVYSEKGVMYKRLTSIAEGAFWLQKADGYYLITNIERE